MWKKVSNNMSMPEVGSHKAQWEQCATEEQRRKEQDYIDNARDGDAVLEMAYYITGHQQRSDPRLPEAIRDLIETGVDRGINALLCKLLHAALTGDESRSLIAAYAILKEAAANKREANT
jgi:hypothetical protein